MDNTPQEQQYRKPHSPDHHEVLARVRLAATGEGGAQTVAVAAALQVTGIDLAASVLAGSASAIFVRDPGGRYLLVNPEAAHLLGRDAGKVLGKSDRELFPNGFTTPLTPFFRHEAAVHESGFTFTFECPFPSRPGDPFGPRRFQVFQYPYRNSDGTIAGVVTVGQDITEIKRAQAEREAALRAREEALQEREEALRQLNRSEQRLSLHLQQTPLGAVEWDTSFCITAWNAAAERIFGYTREEALGQHGCDLLVPTDNRLQVDTVWQALLTGKGGARSHNENTTRDGRIIVCEWYNTPLIGDDGRVLGIASLVQDITEQERAAGALEASENRFRSVVEGLNEGILITGMNDTITYANERMAEMTGYALMNLIGQRASALLAEPEQWEEAQNRRPRREAAASFELKMQRQDGSPFWALVNTAPFKDGAGRVTGMVGAISDISSRKKAEGDRESALAAAQAEETRFRLLTENASDIITILDARGIVRYQSPSVMRLLGYAEEELLGRAALSLVHPEDLPAVEAELFATRRRAGAPSDPVLYRFRHRDGSWRWLESIGTNLLGYKNVRGILVNTRDITERRLAEEEMRWQATHDPLTGLPNRAYFLERLGQSLVVARRRRESLAVLFLDLDRFKHINDTLGHERGDQLLQMVAQRLTDCLPPNAVLARMGGDEFTVLLAGISRPDEAETMANLLLEALRPPVALGAHEFYVGGSIGVSLFPLDGSDADTLLKNADVAMYRAKEQGGGNRLYTPTMSAAVFEHVVLESSLHRALEQGEFILYYQPQVEAVSGRLIGLEALVRWQHPQMGLIGPDAFISLAESTGLIGRLGDWVLRAACTQAAKWQHQTGRFAPVVPVAVNVSARQFRAPGFADHIAGLLAETGLEPRRLNLELTESVLMEEGETNVGTLRRLKRLGVQLSVDDFGTGYSSLAYLRRFPLDTLKIDRAFVRDIVFEEADRAVVKAMVDLAHALKLSVVAEGVEQEAQRESLLALGCDSLQGYLVSRPVPAEAAGDFLYRGFGDIFSRKL